MDNANYKPRLVDARVQELLELFGAVCVEGPKWCGKTWTSMVHAKSCIMLGDPQNNFGNRQMAQIDASSVLSGEQPHLIDEWQEVPAIWDAVRYRVDMGGKAGQYILTGSSTPPTKGILHSGVGRICSVPMYPMSLFESGESLGQASLQCIFDGEQGNAITEAVTLDQLIYYVVRGGWPAAISVQEKAAGEMAKAYVETIINNDIFKLDNKSYDLSKIRLLLRSLARNESTTVTVNKLVADIKEIDAQDVDPETISHYLSLFRRLFIIQNQQPFASNLRSSIRVKQMEKRHFVDPSLACALLKASPKKLKADLQTFGFLFEALCERDLNIYAQCLGGQLYHYQDYKNQEIDAVIELPDGRWGAFEIKLGANQIDEAAATLLSIQENIVKADGQVPAVLCVVCGLVTGVYRRPDGVYVVPITALKP